MVVLFFADIFGKPGRKAIKASLPELKAKYRPDFIIGNGENLAGGKGINTRTFQEMIEMGFDALTSGNHIWDNKDVLNLFERTDRLIRPLNFPDPESDSCPGHGYVILEKGDKTLMLINVMGRVFMDALDCPFASVDALLSEFPDQKNILVDMHADASSEKNAMGWFLDGRVSAVVGSHSHVQTADETILPKGTAYITDVGMSGPFDSVIGMNADEVIRRFITKRRIPVKPSKDNPGISFVAITIGDDGRALKIERQRYTVDNVEGLHGEDLE